MLIKGNHDATLDKDFYMNEHGKYPPRSIHPSKLDCDKAKKMFTENSDYIYLEDSGTSFNNFNIWGSPWIEKMGEWAFMLRSEEQAEEIFKKIPLETDILLTHGPSYGVLDYFYKDWNDIDKSGQKVKRKAGPIGNRTLGKYIDKVKPILHVHGHCHCTSGSAYYRDVLRVNAAVVNDAHDVIHPPKLIRLKNKVSNVQTN